MAEKINAEKKRAIETAMAQIEKQFGAHPLSNPDYGRIVNQKHFDRLCKLIDEKKVDTAESGTNRACASPLP